MKITEKIFDITTGVETIVEREETNAEIKAREKREAEKAKIEAVVNAIETQRQAIADRLGLTADELKVLLG